MTASRPDLYLPVDVEGTLRVDTPTGRSISVAADGAALRVDLPGWPEARALLPRSAESRSRAIRRLARLLAYVDLTLSLASGDKPVCHLGRDVQPNWLARLLGLSPARIPLSAVWLLLRR